MPTELPLHRTPLCAHLCGAAGFGLSLPRRPAASAIRSSRAARRVAVQPDREVSGTLGGFDPSGFVILNGCVSPEGKVPKFIDPIFFVLRILTTWIGRMHIGSREREREREGERERETCTS